jgi:hypothetical protein
MYCQTSASNTLSCGPKGLAYATPSDAAARTEAIGLRCGYKLGADKGEQRGVINKKPFSPTSRNRLPSHIHLWDGWGEGFGAWGLVCGDRDQRGAGVTPAPWRLCPTWNRPGVPQGLTPGMPSWRRGDSGHPCGGTETGSNRADARRKSESNRYTWQG